MEIEDFNKYYIELHNLYKPFIKDYKLGEQKNCFYAWVGNLDACNSGFTLGAWLKMPYDEKAKDTLLKCIGCDGANGNETYIGDIDYTGIGVLNRQDYDLDKLNRIAILLDELPNSEDRKAVDAYYEVVNNEDIELLLENIKAGNLVLDTDIKDNYDYGKLCVEEIGSVAGVLECYGDSIISHYIDNDELALWLNDEFTAEELNDYLGMPKDYEFKNNVDLANAFFNTHKLEEVSGDCLESCFDYDAWGKEKLLESDCEDMTSYGVLAYYNMDYKLLDEPETKSIKSKKGLHL